MQAVQFEDAEDLLRKEWLKSGSGEQAFLSLPADLPDVFLVFTRTGGGLRDIVTDLATISLDVYASRGGSPYEGESVRAFNYAASWLRSREQAGEVLGVPCYEVQQNSGPYRNPDPRAPKHARFTGLFTVALRGVTITI